MKHMLLVLAGLGVIFFSHPASAKDLYVTDSIKAALRNGPGNENNLIKSLSSGDKLALIESQDGWTKVRLADGTEGWIQRQWISADVPKIIQLAALQKKYNTLVDQYDDLKKNNDMILDTNRRLRQTGASEEDSEASVTTEIPSVPVEDSQQYVKLKEENRALQESLDRKILELDAMNDKVKWNLIVWFLSGSGVLLLGLLIGLSMRQKQRHTFL
jgi:SH3 domain protein